MESPTQLFTTGDWAKRHDGDICYTAIPTSDQEFYAADLSDTKPEATIDRRELNALQDEDTEEAADEIAETQDQQDANQVRLERVRAIYTEALREIPSVLEYTKECLTKFGKSPEEVIAVNVQLSNEALLREYDLEDEHETDAQYSEITTNRLRREYGEPNHAALTWEQFSTLLGQLRMVPIAYHSDVFKPLDPSCEANWTREELFVFSLPVGLNATIIGKDWWMSAVDNYDYDRSFLPADRAVHWDIHEVPKPAAPFDLIDTPFIRQIVSDATYEFTDQYNAYTELSAEADK